jgi:VWFA-related protein
MSRKTVLAIFITFIAFAITSPAQQNTPARNAQGNSANENSTVLRVKTRLVVVDVVARDSKGAPVTDLKQDDFTVLEDGKEQKVRIFNFRGPGQPATPMPQPVNQPNTVDNLPRFQSNRALNVILLDSLNTNRVNQASIRDAMIKYLDKLPENEPIAVYLLGDKLTLLQDFTTDLATLKDVVHSFNGKSSRYLNASADGSPIDPVLPGIAGSLPAQMAAQIRLFQDQLAVNLLDQRVGITLSALRSLARTLSGYPGRKNLLWISESFPFAVMLNNINPRSSLTDRNYSPEIARTGNLLSDAQVAIYPLDPSGVAGPVNIQSDSNAGGVPDNLDAHATMNDLAERTGGRAFYNINYVEEAMRQSIDDGSTYYTLGYYPENRDWNGAFRKIQIKLRRGGVKLRYRIGYFAADNTTFVKLNPKKKDEDFDEALRLNVPIATGLPFKAMVIPPSAQTGNKVIVNFGADPHVLSFSETDQGLKQVELVCAVRVFARKDLDKAVATEARKMGGALNAEAYEKVMKSYFPCSDQLTLQPGSYVLRLGVRDNETGLIGTATATLTIAAETSSANPAPKESKP